MDKGAVTQWGQAEGRLGGGHEGRLAGGHHEGLLVVGGDGAGQRVDGE